MTIKRLLIASLCLVGFANLPTLSAQEKADVKVEKLENQDNKAVAKKKDKADNEFMSRLVVGARADLWFSPGNDASLFYLGLHPMAAYRFTDFLRAGPCLGYSYLSYSDNRLPSNSFRTSIFGGGLFLDVRPLPMEQLGFISNIYIKGEIGYFAAVTSDGNGNPIQIDKTRYDTEIGKALVGLGYSSNFGRGASYQMEYLINPFHGERDKYVSPSPIEIRFAIMYGF